MRIVPSGNQRLTKLQQVAKIGPNGQEPAKRDVPEQEDIPAGGQPFNPMSNLQNTLQNQQNNPTQALGVPSKEQLDSAVEPNPGTVGKENVSGPNEEVVDGGSIKIKQALDKVLIDLGVPQRKLIQHDKRRFQYNKKQQSGYFEIPERTGSGQQIGEDAVDKICQQLEQGFNIDTEPVFQGGIWKVTFKPRVVEQQEMASSWDSTDGAAAGQNQRRAAFTKDWLIKESKSSIVEALIKQGFGEKK